MCADRADANKICSGILQLVTGTSAWMTVFVWKWRLSSKYLLKKAQSEELNKPKLANVGRRRKSTILCSGYYQSKKMIWILGTMINQRFPLAKLYTRTSGLSISWMIKWHSLSIYDPCDTFSSSNILGLQTDHQIFPIWWQGCTENQIIWLAKDEVSDCRGKILWALFGDEAYIYFEHLKVLLGVADIPILTCEHLGLCSAFYLAPNL